MKNTILVISFVFILNACANTQEKIASYANKLTSGVSNIVPGKDTGNEKIKSAPLSVPVGAHASMMMESSYDKPIDYIPEALGEWEWKVTTSQQRAQDYFKQGMQLRWAYNVNEAARSMAEARRIDPNCAMCFWGEAFALGSFLNGHMTTEKGIRARSAILKARDVAEGNTSPMEYDLIMASLVRYPENWSTEIANDKQKREPTYQAYADEIAKLYAKYPKNHEIATIYGQALFMLEERRGYRAETPELERLHAVLTGVLDENIAHPGACHLYIHATESTVMPERAVPCADRLSDAVPIASHIQHMPAHTYNRTGMWGKNVTTSIKASQSDIMAKSNKGFSYGAAHNLHMLLYGAAYDGQGAVAIQAGKDYREITDMAPYETLTQIRFGRFEDVLDNENVPDDPFSNALYKFAKGYASLKMGDEKMAREMEDYLFESAQGDLGSEYFRGDYKSTLVTVVAFILQGEIRIAKGDLSGAIQSFENAVEAEDTLGFSEPGPLPFAARHWLGAALIESSDFKEAEMVYRLELEKHPHNGWSLFGLKQALAGQDINDETVNADFEDSWARSNLYITSSRF
tara:strand:- start:1043 stop:2767 length:1725 start_codon:yes stop_codon:yes gene_type:complete